jgi:hypothetical protein
MATQPVSTSMAALLGRIFWMMYGPIFAIILALVIAQRADGWFAGPDIMYFLVLGATLMGRRIEARYSIPQTTTGEPATEAQLRAYYLVAGLLGVGVWVVANLIGNGLAPGFGH